MDIRGKNALITGGAIRVGKAITLGLAEAGVNVVINYNRDAEQADLTAEEARKLGVSVLPVQANIADWEQVQRMFSKIHEDLGEIDILVNNASVFKKTTIPTDSMEDWRATIDVLVNGAFYVSNLAAKDMLKKQEGVMVNIVDLSIWEPWTNYTAHAVGKSALYALTRQFALELHPYVRVNAIALGPVLPPVDYTPERIQKSADRTLLNRWGTPEDVAEAVIFLANAKFITADVIAVDGGQRYGHRKL
jgi:3-oxoacyl-[acyl-carrier protein] reductase/pteridine reductase